MVHLPKARRPSRRAVGRGVLQRTPLRARAGTRPCARNCQTSMPLPGCRRLRSGLAIQTSCCCPGGLPPTAAARACSGAASWPAAGFSLAGVEATALCVRAARLMLRPVCSPRGRPAPAPGAPATALPPRTRVAVVRRRDPCLKGHRGGGEVLRVGGEERWAGRSRRCAWVGAAHACWHKDSTLSGVGRCLVGASRRGRRLPRSVLVCGVTLGPRSALLERRGARLQRGVARRVRRVRAGAPAALAHLEVFLHHDVVPELKSVSRGSRAADRVGWLAWRGKQWRGPMLALTLPRLGLLGAPRPAQRLYPAHNMLCDALRRPMAPSRIGPAITSRRTCHAEDQERARRQRERHETPHFL
jgi:hypothetical protein